MKKISDYLIAGGLVLLLLIIVYACLPREQAPTNANAVKKIKVVASFYPMHDFASNIGKEKVELTTLIPYGSEPHEYEPTPSDIIKLSEADFFIYNGGGLEGWADKLVEGADNKKLIVVETTKGIDLLPAGEGVEATDEGKDPHTWLDPVIAKQQAFAIKEAFQEADPANKQYYEDNYLAYSKKLDKLDSDLRLAFSSCKKKDILITHATLGYFCKEYGCNQMAITGVNPEAEPSPAELIKIIEQAKEKNVKAVFFESLINPKSAELISKEINGYVLAFHSVHGLTDDEKARGEDYYSLMEGNIANIKKALECN
ncbi:MAG: zinc ABC transporter substrate-binding protein [Candidatus Micrarchaeota archaeon]